MKTPLFLSLLFACLFAGATVSAVDLGDVKQRMTRRAPRIGELRAAKTVGENNRGYLEILKPEQADKKDTKLVEDENDDRRLVYEAIAKVQNTSIEVVGKNRALMIAKRADPGIMVQMPDGSWKETR